MKNFLGIVCVALMACAPVDVTPDAPLASESETSQAISCSQTFCFPYTCFPGTTSCQHSGASDLFCFGLACDGQEDSTCADFFISDDQSCRSKCAHITIQEPQFTNCYNDCMSNIQRHCSGSAP